MSTGERPLSFADLIAPIDRDQFFGTIWESRPEIISRNDATYFARLLTVVDVESAISSAGLSFPDIRLVNVTGAPEVQTYTRPDGRVIPPAAFQLFADGATIVLNQLHRRIQKLGDFCRGLECELGIPFQTNVYLSPPNAGGFKVHFDTHDVFVLQIHGRKNWTLYVSTLELPMPGQHHDEMPVEPGAPTQTFMLRPGDVVYIPRGIYHSATAGSELSLHVTLGALSKTWVEVLIEALAELSQREVDLRRALPPGFLTGRTQPDAVKNTFHLLANKFATLADFDGVASAMAQEFARSRDSEAHDQLRQIGRLSEVSEETIVAKRRNAVSILTANQNTLSLQLPQRTIELPAALKPCLQQLLTGNPLKVSELVGPIDKDGRILLVRRLIKEGILIALAY